MVSPVFDREPPQHLPASQRLLILSAPRSGSYYLCRRLWLDGLGMPMEYLNQFHLQGFSRRMPLALTPPRWLRRWRDRPEQRLIATLQSIEERRQANGWFSLKLQPIQLKPWTRRGQKPGQLLEETFSSWQVLPLLRRDWHRQLASLIVSRATGAYDLGLLHTWTDPTACRGPVLTPKRLLKAARQLRQDTDAILDWLEKHPHQDPLWFEDLLQWNPSTWREELQKRLPGLSQTKHQQLVQGIADTPLQRRQDPFREAKTAVTREMTDALRHHPDAQPPTRLQKWINN